MPLVRVFYDLKGFFMGVVRAVLLELELRLGVFPEVTSAMQALQADGTGRISTAHGLTDPFCVPDGTDQGCKLGTDRALFSLLPVQVTLSSLVLGHHFISRIGSHVDEGSVQSWFADDVTLFPKDAFQAQHSADVMDFYMWMDGNEVAVDSKGKKSAFAIAECQAGTGLASIGELYSVHLPRGDALPIPTVKGAYRNLGTDADVRVRVCNTETFERVVHRCTAAIRLLGRVCGNTRIDLDRLIDAVVRSVLYFYTVVVPPSHGRPASGSLLEARCTPVWGTVTVLDPGFRSTPLRTKEASA